jgi:hypothetical protein
MQATEQAFSEQTIGQMLSKPNRTKPLCDITVEGKNNPDRPASTGIRH